MDRGGCRAAVSRAQRIPDHTCMYTERESEKELRELDSQRQRKTKNEFKELAHVDTSPKCA